VDVTQFRGSESPFRFQTVLLTAFLLFAFAIPAICQDDVTTQNASSAPGGAWITGPASNPLSFLNGPAYRGFGSSEPYDFHDFHPASLLDKHLPQWIGFEVEERLRYESYHNGGFTLNNDDSYFLNRFRYQMDIRPANWFKLVSQVQDARPISEKLPHGPPNEARWDLKLAYAELGNPEKQWISVRVGRQLINYNNTIIANSEWRNQGRSYDAAATNLRYHRYSLGIFAASAVIPRDVGISHHGKGNNIHGSYGRIADLLPNSMLELFVLWRLQPSVAIENRTGSKTGKQDEKAYGFRFKGKAAARLDYSIEAVAERGSDGPDPIRAWGVSSGAAYTFNGAGWRPRFFGQYDYASGDKHPADGIHGAFDTMYPTAHDRFGIADQFGWQNIAAGRGGMTLEPHHRWTVSAQVLTLRLASATDGLYNTSGGMIVRDASGKSGIHIGEEFDVYTWYELNAHINVGAGLGHLFPGSFLAATTSGPAYNYPYFAINFKDNGKTRN
jgi:hypothetical protein